MGVGDVEAVRKCDEAWLVPNSKFPGLCDVLSRVVVVCGMCVRGIVCAGGVCGTCFFIFGANISPAIIRRPNSIGLDSWVMGLMWLSELSFSNTSSACVRVCVVVYGCVCVRKRGCVREKETHRGRQQVGVRLRKDAQY